MTLPPAQGWPAAQRHRPSHIPAWRPPPHPGPESRDLEAHELDHDLETCDPGWESGLGFVPDLGKGRCQGRHAEELPDDPCPGGRLGRAGGGIGRSRSEGCVPACAAVAVASDDLGVQAELVWS